MEIINVDITGVYTLLELGTMCVHDPAINTFNVQKISPLNLIRSQICS